jgi:hypothetical protein
MFQPDNQVQLGRIYGGFESRAALLPIHTYYSKSSPFFYLDAHAKKLEATTSWASSFSEHKDAAKAAARLLSEGNKQFNIAASKHVSGSVYGAKRNLDSAFQSYQMAAAKISLAPDNSGIQLVRNSLGMYHSQATSFFRDNPSMRTGGAGSTAPESPLNLNKKAMKVARQQVKGKSPFTDAPRRTFRKSEDK